MGAAEHYFKRLEFIGKCRFMNIQLREGVNFGSDVSSFNKNVLKAGANSIEPLRAWLELFRIAPRPT